jgi:uncharacterized protein YqhQ
MPISKQEPCLVLIIFLWQISSLIPAFLSITYEAIELSNMIQRSPLIKLIVIRILPSLLAN